MGSDENSPLATNHTVTTVNEEIQLFYLIDYIYRTTPIYVNVREKRRETELIKIQQEYL